MIPCSFNPRAPERRDMMIVVSTQVLMFQSTRPREARLAKYNQLETMQVSIHAPTRGATWHRQQYTNDGKFQSTRPREARLDVYPMIFVAKVSIHAPTRGATSSQVLPLPEVFQSTRPREARRASLRNGIQILSFNPRAHERRDVGHSPCVDLSTVSIHAPTRGATYVSD